MKKYIFTILWLLLGVVAIAQPTGQRYYANKPVAVAVATDPNWSSVVLRTQTDGVNNSTNITDAKGVSTLTLSGDTKTSTTQTLFGEAPFYQDGTGDLITTNASSNFDLSTGDWTIDGWSYSPGYSGYSVIFAIGTQNSVVSNTFGLFGNNGNGTVSYLINGSGAQGFNTSYSWPTNAWVYFELVKSGSTTTLYVDGVSRGSTTNAPPPSGSTCRLYTYNAQGNYYTGYLFLRVTKGVARANTVPSTAFPKN